MTKHHAGAVGVAAMSALPRIAQHTSGDTHSRRRERDAEKAGWGEFKSDAPVCERIYCEVPEGTVSPRDVGSWGSAHRSKGGEPAYKVIETE